MDISPIVERMSAAAARGHSPEGLVLEWLSILLSFRQARVTAELMRRWGGIVMEGPFKGMDLSGRGVIPSQVLGCYEASLHPHVERCLERSYDCLLNIGCSFGYYAVGFAMRCPGLRVHAHDIDEKAMRECHAMAQRNGVADRVRVGGLFEGERFADFADRRTLVLCDIEGGEVDLLDPEAYPALRAMDLIVELHECYRPGALGAVVPRFEATHDIVLVGNDLINCHFSAPEMAAWSALDQCVAVWEGRPGGGTPWAVMTHR